MSSKLLVFSLMVACAGIANAQSSPKDAMKGLRKMMLTRTAAEWQIKPDKIYPSVFAVAMDFPIGSQTATTFSVRDGSTSLYTTGTFGIIGGGEHPSVSRASKDLVQLSQSFWASAKPTKSIAYPSGDQVRFYLLGYGGMRVVESTTKSLSGGKDRLSPLWVAGNRVITELRTKSGVR